MISRVRSSRSLSTAVFCVGCLVAALVLFHLGRGTFFRGDDWDMIVYQRDYRPATLFHPHADHLVVTEIAAFELLRSVARWHYGAYRWVMILLHLAVATGVFIFVRRRVSGWLSLIVLPLLFLGVASAGFFWAGVMADVASLAFGIAALLLLDGVEVHRRNRLAVCALLFASIASFTWGVAFALAVGAALVVTPTTRRMAWIAAAPLVAYAVWRLVYPAHGLSLDNLRETPIFVADSLAAAFGGITGLGVGWGRLMALGAGLLLVGGLRRAGRVSVTETATLSLPFLVWVLTGIGRAAPDGSAIVSDPRYLYAGVATVLMAFAVVVAKSRPPRLVTGALLPLALIGLLVNAFTLRQDAAAARNQANSVRAYIGALEIAQPVLRPNFGLTDVSPNQDVSALIGSFEASPFQKAVRRIGNEPVDLKALPRLSPDRRQVVDDVLVRALGLHLAAPLPAPAHRQCTTIEVGMGRELRLSRNRLDLGVGPQPADVFVRRYANAPAQRLVGSLSPGEPASLVAPHDRSRVPWFVRVVSRSPVRACRPR